MLDVTLLTIDQVSGENKLDILKNETGCVISDFAIMLGGSFINETINKDLSYLWNLYDSQFSQNIIKKISSWCTQSKDEETGRILCCFENGNIEQRYVFERTLGVRPVLSYLSIGLYAKNRIINDDGVLEVEFGEYPQTLVPSVKSMILETAYLNGDLSKTGKCYTTDSNNTGDFCYSFKARKFDEYEYDGKKYVRIIGDNNSKYRIFANQMISIDCPYWVEVEPIKWLVDIENNLAVSKKIILSGIQFNKNNDYDGNFEHSDIKKFLNRYFSKEIFSEKDLDNSKIDDVTLVGNASLDEWVNWSNENNIHPIIHMFMIYTKGKYINTMTDWLKISNILYSYSDIESLRDLLEENIYRELVSLYTFDINLDDILNGIFDIDSLTNMSSLKKYLLVAKLTLVNEKDYDCISKFIKLLGKKYSLLYESLFEQCMNMKNNYSLK